MNDEYQTHIINTIARIMADHVGPGEAITRKQLLRCLIGRSFDTSDREMRAIIKEHLPHILYCSRGYFIARSKDDVDDTIQQNTKRAISLYVQNERIRQAHPVWFRESGQRELFN